jgi:excisionase family DNA binding protein
MEATQSDILTVDEAAELLKIPRSSVYTLAQQGRMPAKKVGRHWRFHRQTIVEWIKGSVSTSTNNFGHPLDDPDK